MQTTGINPAHFRDIEWGFPKVSAFVRAFEANCVLRSFFDQIKLAGWIARFNLIGSNRSCYPVDPSKMSFVDHSNRETM